MSRWLWKFWPSRSQSFPALSGFNETIPAGVETWTLANRCKTRDVNIRCMEAQKPWKDVPFVATSNPWRIHFIFNSALQTPVYVRITN